MHPIIKDILEYELKRNTGFIASKREHLIRAQEEQEKLKVLEKEIAADIKEIQQTLFVIEEALNEQNS